MFEVDYKISIDKVVLLVPETLKTTKAGYHWSPLELKTFRNSELCGIAHLKQYIKMSAPLEILVETNYYWALYDHISQSQPQLSQGGMQL